MRPLILTIFGQCCVAACDGVPCTPEGGKYLAKHLESECCAGLVPVGGYIPSDDYPGDDLPEGCGRTAAPVDEMQCLPCGNGTCDPDEQFCNCPEDCPREP